MIHNKNQGYSLLGTTLTSRLVKGTKGLVLEGAEGVGFGGVLALAAVVTQTEHGRGGNLSSVRAFQGFVGSGVGQESAVSGTERRATAINRGVGHVFCLHPQQEKN